MGMNEAKLTLQWVYRNCDSIIFFFCIMDDLYCRYHIEYLTHYRKYIGRMKTPRKHQKKAVVEIGEHITKLLGEQTGRLQQITCLGLSISKLKSLTPQILKTLELVTMSMSHEVMQSIDVEIDMASGVVVDDGYEEESNNQYIPDDFELPPSVQSIVYNEGQGGGYCPSSMHSSSGGGAVGSSRVRSTKALCS
jgi:hypothetical protein